MPVPRERLSVVLPMWNEAEGFAACLADVTRAGDGLVERGRIAAFEIIVVDDGSTDATGSLADAASRTDQRVVTVHHDGNRGLGAAVRSGLRQASGDLLLYTDADLPADLSEIDTALDLIDDGAGMVSAYRLDRLPDGVKRLAYSIVWNALVRVVLGLPVRDVNFAFKLARASSLDPTSLCSESSFIDVEMIARVRLAGGRVEQFGTKYHPRTTGSSSLATLAVIWAMLRDLVRLRHTLRQSRRQRTGAAS